jgi:hypothetical protein
MQLVRVGPLALCPAPIFCYHMVTGLAPVKDYGPTGSNPYDPRVKLLLVLETKASAASSSWFSIATTRPEQLTRARRKKRGVTDDCMEQAEPAGKVATARNKVVPLDYISCAPLEDAL